MLNGHESLKSAVLGTGWLESQSQTFILLLYNEKGVQKFGGKTGRGETQT
jgi:hypothetical protein